MEHNFVTSQNPSTFKFYIKIIFVINFNTEEHFYMIRNVKNENLMKKIQESDQLKRWAWKYPNEKLQDFINIKDLVSYLAS